MSRCVGLTVVLAASLLLLATGCGSDSDEAGTTEATQTTGTTGGNERLTTEQWSEYEAVRASFQQANTAAMAKLDTCGQSADLTEQNTGQLADCTGDVFTELADQTASLTTVLEGFEGTVSGACADALAELLNYTRPYQATVQQMQTVIDDNDLAAYPGVSSNLGVVAADGKQAVDSFEASCKPA